MTAVGTMVDVELSATQARRIAVSSQGLGSRRFGRGRVGVLRAIRHLGYVQIDTISVVERAHHHVLWNRVPGYRREHLERLVAERSVLEYWAHAAAYLPMEDYRFCLPRMRAIAEKKRHWLEHDERLAREVLTRIRLDGAMRPGDFEHHTGSSGMWQWGPVKRAIEYLFMTGELLVTRRENFQKVFDLAERVLPARIDTAFPTPLEYAHHLVERYIRANGIAHPRDFGHLRPHMREPIARAIEERLESGTLLSAAISGTDGRYLLCRDFERRLSQRLPRAELRLLSPFDNLIIQRDRARRLFDFDFQLECYLPKHRRRYGYFCLPVLWHDRLVARLDAKADRRAGVLGIHRVFPEPALRRPDELTVRLAPTLAAFAEWNGCSRVEGLQPVIDAKA